ncbi:MAG: ABC transporter ATP-binding protein [Myxococcota bacterium]|nr:ABC transporter ATP-binding protein [Myxococcota bacterium]
MSAALAPAQPPPAIRLRGFEKRFGAKRALAGLDLAIEGAQLVGVVGPDGAGKSTLLRALAGLLEVEAEEASVLGHDLRGDVRALKRCVGYVPQVFALQRDLSVLENLRFTARLHRIPHGVFEERTRDLLARTALAPFTARPAGALSGGMKQKLAIVNALLPDPAMLVLDECTAGVDVLARAEILEILEERRAHSLVVLSTSYVDEAARCDRLVYLESGRLVALGTPGELRARANIELYRAWGDAPRVIARAARALEWVAAVRAGGIFTRVEVPLATSPGEVAALRALAALPGVRAVERIAVDMEATLLTLARRRAA